MITIIFAPPRTGKTCFMTYLLNEHAFNRERTKCMERELKSKNQRQLKELIYGVEKKDTKQYGYLDYNRNPDLEHHSKTVRFIYYLLYDRITLKRRVKEILKNKKRLTFIGKGVYSMGRKIVHAKRRL